MASLVLGGGTSHSVLLASSPEHWARRARHDQMNPNLYDEHGRAATYAELLERNRERMQGHLDRSVWDKQWDQCQTALDRMADDIAAAQLDAIIIVGDDQEELFTDGNRPALAICGDESLRTMYLPSGGSEFMELVTGNYSMDAEHTFPGSPDLARGIVASLTESGFDVTWMSTTPSKVGFGHAYGFILQRLLREQPVPMVPIMLNTYYPPNQPTPSRCYDLGVALAKAVNDQTGDLRVGLLASGGLSHFVVNEDLDARLLDAIERGSADDLRALPPELMNSGTSEMRNWITVAGAMGNRSLAWKEYVPIYRSEAGTGCAMAFMLWS
jgi:3-O-methylgallate 3,4-dioxygenase